jgi:hypothetical protein
MSIDITTCIYIFIICLLIFLGLILRRFLSTEEFEDTALPVSAISNPVTYVGDILVKQQDERAFLIQNLTQQEENSRSLVDTAKQTLEKAESEHEKAMNKLSQAKFLTQKAIESAVNNTTFSPAVLGDSSAQTTGVAGGNSASSSSSGPSSTDTVVTST